jgi:FKBP-type peptidyl-prolyl cis-trans isomerase FkpA
MKRITLLLLLATIAMVGCKKFDPEKQADLDETLITDYIRANSLSATGTGSGLYYTIDTLGLGVYPTLASSVTVVYKGSLLDGKVFDESSAVGATFPLRSVIAGWQEGIPKYKAGGKGKLLIPSGLGYGNQSVGTIPVNSVLLFDIHLISVQ